MENDNQNNLFTQNGVSKNDINSSIGENCRRCVYADVNGKPADNEFCNNCSHNEKNKTGGYGSATANAEKNSFDNPYSQGAQNYQDQQTNQPRQENQNGANPCSYGGNGSQNIGGQDGRKNNTVSGLSIASLVLGILSLVLCCNPIKILGLIIVPLQFVCALLAIIFAAITIKKPPKGFAIAGLVTGIVSMALFVFVVVFVMLLGVAVMPL